MKKKIISIAITFILFFSLSLGLAKPAYAAGVTITPSAWTITEGESVYVTVTVSSDLEIYAYNISVSGSGALSGGTQEVAGGVGNHSVSVGCTLYSAGSGTGTITVSGEVSDDETKEYVNNAVSVTVNATGGETGGTGGAAGAGDDYGYGDGNYINDNPTGEGSGDTGLQTLRVLDEEKNEIVLKDEGNDIFSATVANYVKKITIDAVTSDENASVEGDGEKTLNVGENKFDLTVTAENGLQQGYRICLTRKDDKLFLADLEKELKNVKGDSVTVQLKEGDVLDAKLLKALKDWGKTLILQRLDEEKKEKDEKADKEVLYYWTVLCADIPDDLTSWDPAVTFTSPNEALIDELSNYAKGTILHLAHSGLLPKGTTLTLPNKDALSKETKLRLYYADIVNKAMVLQEEPIVIDEKTITLQMTHASEFLLTRAKIADANADEGKTDVRQWIMIGEAALVIVLAVIIIIMLAKQQKKKKPRRTEEKRPSEDSIDEEDILAGIEMIEPAERAEGVEASSLSESTEETEAVESVTRLFEENEDQA